MSRANAIPWIGGCAKAVMLMAVFVMLPIEVHGLVIAKCLFGLWRTPLSWP